jgi:chromate transporter
VTDEPANRQSEASVETTPPGDRDPSQAARLKEVVVLFLRLGFTAFGGPAAHIAMMREEVVQRRNWLDNERFVDLIGIASLIPGPSSTELAIYLGYLRAGPAGLLAAGVCFIAPAMLIVLALAWVYVKYGSLPQVGWLFYGIQPVVVAIITLAIWNLGRTVFKAWLAACVAILVLALYLLGVNVLILLFGGAAFFGMLHWLLSRRGGKQGVMSFSLPLLWLRIHGAWLRSLPELTGLGVSSTAAAPFSLPLLFLTFLKLGAVVYGSGYTLLAFLRADLVQNLHWLTDQQLLDAVSVGQFTPGPVFTTATFIGYVLGGVPGALLATVGIFLPSFVFIALIHPVARRLRQERWTEVLLDGVNSAALALMAGVLIQLGRHALIDGWTWAIAISTLLVLLRFKINSVWLILAGAAIGLARSWMFV